MHSHGHGDHIGGDEGFSGRPDTVIVGHKAEEVADFFAIKTWPTETVSYDLGGRVIDIIPTPGHHDSHVMVYDQRTKLLFSGDVIYPGRLYFRCDKAIDARNSIDRLAEFASTRDLKWILGAHIELGNQPGKSFSSQENARTDEHLLELAPIVITDLQTALHKMGARVRVETHDDFIIFPHPADPRGKSPPDWCMAENVSD